MRQGSADRSFAAAGQDEPVAVCCLGQDLQGVEPDASTVVTLPFSPGGQMSAGDGAGKSVVALRPSGENQEVIGVGVHRGGGRGALIEAEFGSDHSGKAEMTGSIGKPDHSVEAVMVGDRQRIQLQLGRLGNELFGLIGAVKKAESRVGVKLGVGHAGASHGRPPPTSSRRGRSPARRRRPRVPPPLEARLRCFPLPTTTVV